jgi:hypothetical protein
VIRGGLVKEKCGGPSPAGLNYQSLRLKLARDPRIGKVVVEQ